MKKTIIICDFCKDEHEEIYGKCKYCKKDFCDDCGIEMEIGIFRREILKFFICNNCWEKIENNMVNLKELIKKIKEEVEDYISKIKISSDKLK